MVPASVVDHAPITVLDTEAYTLPLGPPISVPVPKQFGFASGRGLENQPTVSDRAVFMIFIANY